jgi:hypothetical protein
MTVSYSVHLRMRNVSGKSCREIKTHILCSGTLFFENCAVCEKKNCTARQATDNNMAYAFHAVYLRLQIHTQNM